MVQGGFAPIDEGIWSLKPPTLVAPPPLQSQREARRDAMWQRVAGRARVRALTSVEREGEDASLTRNVVRSVMDDSRANEPNTEMTDEEADAFAQEPEAELESQQATEPPPATAASSSGSSSEPLSEYELQRLRNIARNQQVLEGLGLASAPLVPHGKSSQASVRKATRSPGQSGAAPTRRSSIVQSAMSYAEGGGEAASTLATGCYLCLSSRLPHDNMGKIFNKSFTLANLAGDPDPYGSAGPRRTAAE